MLNPLPPTECYSILSAEPISRVEPLRWAHQAKTFLDAEIEVEAATEDDIFVRVGVLRVPVRSFPVGDCPDVMMAANRGVDAIGGAGMDVLVRRAQRVWQVALVDRRASLLVAALLASVLLGPIVPPDEVTIYGVRGARQRLDHLIGSSDA